MALLSKQPFTTASPLLANFDYNDIENGIGYSKFYAVKYSTSAGTSHFLSTVLFGNKTYTSGGVNVDSSPLNITRTVKGKALVTGTTSAGSSSGTFTCTISKIDGITSAVTSLGSVTSASISGAEDIGLAFDLTEIILNVGDYLRATISLSAGVQVLSTEAAPVEIYIPFKINL